MFCTRCGKKNLEQANFCFSCGNPLPAAQSAPIPPVASTPAPESQVVESPEVTVGSPAVHRPAAKRCPSCGLPNRQSAERCACGYSFAQTPEGASRSMVGAAPQVILAGSRRPGIITLLAVLQFIGAVLLILIALICLGVGLFADTTDAGALLLGGILCGAFGALEAVCGFGLWKLKGYGRKIQLVFSWIGLIGFPVGTIISILILVYLYKPGVKVLFAGKPASQFTPEEAAQVAALTQGLNRDRGRGRSNSSRGYCANWDHRRHRRAGSVEGANVWQRGFGDWLPARRQQRTGPLRAKV